MNTDRPLALVSDESLLDEVLRLAAVAQCDVQRAPDIVAVRRNWADAPLVLLDEVAVAECVAAGVPRRDGLLVLCAGKPPPDLWPRAVAIGAEEVLALPDAAEYVVGRLADAVRRPATVAGRVIAVLGGRGGSGASVLAAGTALAALRGGKPAMLVDCDSLGGGVDLLLGMDGDPGLRWPGIKVSGGRIAMESLRSALPGRSRGAARLTVVSCDRDGSGPAPDAVGAVIDAGRRSGETVVCDLPRAVTPAARAALARADLTVLILPAEVRASAAGQRVADQLAEQGVRGQLVVRGPAPGGLFAEDIARVVGLPLLATMRPEPGLARTLEHGGLRPRPRGPLMVVARAVLGAARAGAASNTIAARVPGVSTEPSDPESVAAGSVDVQPISVGMAET
ncbi:MAG TPA: septum site-determining protein Ssd [Pseudonocardiaceae bacterium]|jgi:secretion/DNA translocation related CpaE-like protein|nr:septum site-determining protein Ssd [Pseudonocardiaceae bacterium]